MVCKVLPVKPGGDQPRYGQKGNDEFEHGDRTVGRRKQADGPEIQQKINQDQMPAKRRPPVDSS